MTNQKPQLSLFALTMISIGATIASGIFKTPAAIASKIHDNQTILWLWVLGGVVSLIGALVFAEMGSRFSNAGGVYTYLNKAFGNLPGFLYGWCLLTVISSGTIAALCTVFAENIILLTGLPESSKVVVAVVSIIVLTLFNTFGIKYSEWFANVGTVLKMIGIYALLAFIVILGKEAVLPDGSFAPTIREDDDPAGALVKVLWTFTGWHYASFVAGDAKNPKTQHSAGHADRNGSGYPNLCSDQCRIFQGFFPRHNCRIWFTRTGKDYSSRSNECRDTRITDLDCPAYCSFCFCRSWPIHIEHTSDIQPDGRRGFVF